MVDVDHWKAVAGSLCYRVAMEGPKDLVEDIGDEEVAVAAVEKEDRSESMEEALPCYLLPQNPTSCCCEASSLGGYYLHFPWLILVRAYWHPWTNETLR